MDRGEGVSKSDAAKHAALNFGANVAFNPLDPYGIVSMGSSFVPEIMEGIHYLRTGKGDEEAPIVNRLANTFRFANPSSWAAGISDKLGDETRSIPFTTSIDPGDRDERLNLIFKTKDALKTNLLNLGWSDKGANDYLDTHQNYDDRYKALKDTHAYFNYNRESVMDVLIDEKLEYQKDWCCVLTEVREFFSEEEWLTIYDSVQAESVIAEEAQMEMFCSVLRKIDRLMGVPNK